MVKKIYCARVNGFTFDIKGGSINVYSMDVEKETPKQYQLSRNGKSGIRLNKYYIGSSDSIGNFYALTPEEAVANLKIDLQKKIDVTLKELERLNHLKNCKPNIE